MIASTLALVSVFLIVFGVEALVSGPSFNSRGVDDLVFSRAIGFGAQPVLVTNVGGEREPREALYLGGNADLYVLVYPCGDDEVEYVSVGAHRLAVIDEVTCATDAS